MNEREKNHDLMLARKLETIHAYAEARICPGFSELGIGELPCDAPLCPPEKGCDPSVFCHTCEGAIDAINPLRVYLDDNRETPAGWLRVWNASETIALLKTGSVEELSLDHDLGVSEDGYDVIKWLEKEYFTESKLWIDPTKVHVHSANPEGARRMLQGLERIYRAIHNNFK